jgi:hypothetical protein
MKKYLLLFSIISCSLVSNAQFTDASLVEYNVGLTPILSNNTGNDILDFGGNTYEVSVWDDNNINNAGLSWKVGTWTGFIFFNSSYEVRDPDVSLVKNNAGNVYAVTAYFANNTNEYICEIFTWSNAAHQFNYVSSNVMIPGVFGTTVNLDANDAGDFAIVFDDPAENVFIVTGSTIGSTVPQLNLSGTPMAIGSGRQPDVCMYRNSAGFKQVDVAYINSANVIAVDFLAFADISVGNINITPAYRSPAADLTYQFPRISCPGSFYGDPTDWTVVAEDTDGSSTWYIKSFNYNSCCPPYLNIYIYNDGSTQNSPFNLTDYPNTKPVVSYDHVYDNIWISWTLDNSLGLLSAPGAPPGKYPVAVVADKLCRMRSAQDFLIVPTYLPYFESFNNVSISGRKSTKSLLTWHHAPDNDIYSKTVTNYTYPTNFRINETSNIYAWLDYVSQLESDSSPILTLHLYDTAGRLTQNYSGSPSEIHSLLNENKNQFLIARIFSENGMYNFTGKVTAAE